jgi:hypothetical protein
MHNFFLAIIEGGQKAYMEQPYSDALFLMATFFIGEEVFLLLIVSHS